MPFDLRPLPTREHQERARPLVALWLFVLCFMLLVMVALGGATRLTGSGLSIMEWDPIMGFLPPRSDAEWNRLYALYQQIPQYSLINQGFGLDGFKHIFWLEWTHRLWGRLIGIVLLGPLVWFGFTRTLPAWLWRRMALLFALGALQGAMGWFMVASGFDADRTSVSPYRLVLHLVFALSIYGLLFWTAMSVARSGPRRLQPIPKGLAAGSLILICMVGLTIVAGGFVAGLKAGLTYNTFPLMDGHIIPEGWGMLHPWWKNLFENIPAVQFDHRLLATVTVVFALCVAALGNMFQPQGGLKLALAAVGVAACGQFLLGVATLLYAVPVSLGTLHQIGAVILLTAALALRHILRR
jgi:heme a synthase